MVCRRFMIWKRKKFTLCILLLLSIMLLSHHFYGHTSNAPVSVFVIEEHHEALPYWIDTSNNGRMQKFGNTLVHIDGHADDALPNYMPEMPFFHWPWTEFEVDLLLQQNDVFIMEAISIGLVDRFLWIVPEWNNETKDVDLEVTDMALGWMDIKKEGQDMTVFCVCEEKYSEKDTDKVHTGCYYLNDTFEPPGYPNININPPELCQIQRKFTYEVMPMKVAIERINEGELFSKVESVILDIDEDYFGCEIPGRRLYDVGFTWNSFEDINDNLSVVFCPQFIHHEVEASDIMSHFMNTFMGLCKYTSLSQDGQKCAASLQAIISHVYSFFIVHWKNDPLFFCSRTNVQLKDSLAKMIKSFYNLHPRQLAAIQKVGFCLNASPKTVWFDDEGQFILCHGNNDPDKPMVQVYVPDSESVLTSSLELVNKFLHQMPVPRVVTLCRSVRDGYTPRSIFKRVEQHLLKYFKSQKDRMNSKSKEDFSEVYRDDSGKMINGRDQYNIQYDNHLLNGSYGLSRKWL